MMNVTQTTLGDLTKKLELKAKEYEILCNKLSKLKEKNIAPNDERLLVVKELFQNNHDDISRINAKIREIKRTN